MAEPERNAVREARALLARGEGAEAMRLLDRAVMADPGDMACRRLRGEIAIREGRMEAARADLEAVVRAEPGDVSLLHALAGACHATGSASTAIGYLERALALAPGQPRLWHSLGLVCHGAGRYQAALDAYQRALAIDPGLSPAAIGIAKIRQLLGELEPARRIFESVLARDPGNLDALGGLVLQEELLGNVERAMGLLESARQRHPLSPDLVIPWARLRRRAGHAAEARASLEAILPRIADVQTRALALFALGQALDDLGDNDRAFAVITEANALKPRDFDAEGHRRRLNAIAHAWTREALEGLAGMGSTSDQPVFIVGMPRSGTSLLEQILSRHPRIHACGELGAIGAIAAEWQDDRGVVAPTGLTREGLLAAAGQYLQEAGAGDAARFTDKMPANFIHLGVIHALFPNARVIHCLRDPLDTCLSCYFQDFSALGLSWSCRLEDIADYYDSYKALMDHWRLTMDLPMLEVAYEDMVAGVEDQIRRVLAFLGLAWDPTCLAFEDSDRPVITASFDQVSRGLYGSAVGRHKTYRKHLGPLLRIAEADGDER